MVMKRHSYKKNYNIKNKRKSKINGGRPPQEDNEQCREITTLRLHDGRVNSVAFHPSAPLLATGSQDNTAKLWHFDPHSSLATCMATLDEHIGSVTSVAFHLTAPLLATSSWDQTAKLWRFNTDGTADNNMMATRVANLEGHYSRVMSVAFHPTAPLLATASWDQTAKLWRFNPDGSVDNNMSATCVATLHGHGSILECVAFHPTAPILATGSFDKTAKLWRFNTDGSTEDNMSATCVATLEGHHVGVASVAFHPTAPLLATGSHVTRSYDETVKLWRFDPYGSFANNMSATCVAIQNGHDGSVDSVAFHPTAPILATSSDDRTTKLWRFDPERLTDDNILLHCVVTLRRSGYITSVAFHPTAPILATSSRDKTTKLWRCKILETPYNNFILYSKNADVEQTICNKLCSICNLNLCMKNAEYDNNINGYVVTLTDGRPKNDIHFHYSCLYRYLSMGHHDINDIPISTETITRILNIENKTEALIGTDFYK
jgi:WD40 repeat protein